MLRDWQVCIRCKSTDPSFRPARNVRYDADLGRWVVTGLTEAGVYCLPCARREISYLNGEAPVG